MTERASGRPADYAAAIGIISLASAGCFLFRPQLTVTDVAMLLLLAVVVVASRYPRGPALVASTLSTAAFDFLFVPPYYTFAVRDTSFVLTFVTMFAVALIMSRLAAVIREQAGAARLREQRITALHAMHRDLVDATHGGIAAILTQHVGRATRGDVQVVIGEAASAVAAWNDKALLLPLRSPTRQFGIISVTGDQLLHPLAADERHLLELMADQAGQALERLTLAQENEASRVEIEAERLRTALLSSLSHDLRTPLGTIEGAATTLVSDAALLTAESRRDLGEAIIGEVRRMSRLITNLLDMMRLETGTLAVHRSWQPLEESLGVALIRLDDRLQSHPVAVQLPPDLPLVFVDEVLLEQVFVNLLENAIKYTPAGTAIDISARLEHFAVVVEVADRGPGVPAGEERNVFRKFHRVASEHHAAGPVGSGLGLTICEGIIAAHRGRIWLTPRHGGGAAFQFTLPLDAAPPPAAPENAPMAGGH